MWDYPNDREHIFYVFVVAILIGALLNIFDVRITSTAERHLGLLARCRRRSSSWAR